MLRIYDYKGFPDPPACASRSPKRSFPTRSSSFRSTFRAANTGCRRSPENPTATVPVLELDDGTCISECTAITEYIDNLVGEPVLTGKTARDRAVIHMMQRRAETGLLDAAATFFHHATPGLGPKIELYQNREWGEKNRERAIDGMRYLDQVLTKQPFLAGDNFTMADITAFAGLAYVAIAKIDVPAGLDNLKFWRERVASRPSIART